jgi:hypothetical protein
MDVHLTGAHGVHELPQLLHPLSLTTFRLANTRELDVASLTQAVNLEWIDLYRALRVLNIDSLLRFTKLREVEIGGVKYMPGRERLSELDVPRLMVDPNHVIPKRMQTSSVLAGDGE